MVKEKSKIGSEEIKKWIFDELRKNEDELRTIEGSVNEIKNQIEDLRAKRRLLDKELMEIEKIFIELDERKWIDVKPNVTIIVDRNRVRGKVYYRGTPFWISFGSRKDHNKSDEELKNDKYLKKQSLDFTKQKLKDLKQEAVLRKRIDLETRLPKKYKDRNFFPPFTDKSKVNFKKKNWYEEFESIGKSFKDEKKLEKEIERFRIKIKKAKEKNDDEIENLKTHVRHIDMTNKKLLDTYKEKKNLIDQLKKDLVFLNHLDDKIWWSKDKGVIRGGCYVRKRRLQVRLGKAVDFQEHTTKEIEKLVKQKLSEKVYKVYRELM